MAITQNPHSVRQVLLTPGSSPSPLEVFDFGKIVVDSGIVPADGHHTVNFQGNTMVTGDLGPATRKEVSSVQPNDLLQSLQFMVNGPNNKPRIIMSISPGLQQLTFHHQHEPAKEKRDESNRLLSEWLATLVASPGMPGLVPRRSMRIDGYLLMSKLGEGYSAEVWKAKVEQVPPGVNLKVGDVVALKLYTLLMNGIQTIRVQREFKIAATAAHENLVRVYDLMLSPSRPLHNFLAMEFVNGRDLKSIIPSKGFHAERVINIARQVFAALGELHSHNALHRDVKAANIMVISQGGIDQIKLCDLGIVSVVSDPSMTGTMFMGSKHSAPMEQLAGKQLDERADVYGAGSVMYHCYTGRPMYSRSGTEGAIVIEMLETPEKLQPKDPRDQPLVDIINRCIEVEASKRPNTAARVLEQLNELPPP